MSTKFGLLIDFDVPKTVASTGRDPEAALTLRDRHLDKRIWHHISAVGDPIRMKLGSLVQNNIPIMVVLSQSKPEVEFQYGRRFYPKRK